MSNLFKLEILTPKREFFNSEVEALTFTSTDGERTILAGHAPMISTLGIGTLKIKQDGEWKTAFQSEGFVEVRPDEVLVFSQLCEWDSEIDLVHVERIRAAIEEEARSEQSIAEQRHTAISLTRTLMRLKVANQSKRKL
ncbi:MAG: ATP synthase F1 subunit epsilon [Ruminococcaceae bacterium]|jgi:F-type H+-transporting ATPase subunit epsilon|nr:ATP synthase F1 subunit epsilon [Oscillospiraceae bacterium]